MRVRETIRVTALPGIGSFTGVLWLMEQYASQTSWWSMIPWGVITLLVLGFWLGHDVYDSNSVSRIWYRRLRSFGEFQNVITRHECSSLHNDGVEKDLNAIYLPFVFSKERLLDEVRIKTTITGYMANKLTVIDRMQNSYDDEWPDTSFIAKRYVSGSKIEIPIAFIPREHGDPGVYGDKKLSRSYFREGTAHFVEITLSSGKQRQRHTVQIFMPLTQFFNDPILGINSGRFVMFENGKIPTPA